MPRYEYSCRGCGKVFDVLQKVTDEVIKECKDCGGSVEKLISRTSFQLKGDGWASDGYSSKDASSDKGEGCKDSGTKPECSGCPSAS